MPEILEVNDESGIIYIQSFNNVTEADLHKSRKLIEKMKNPDASIRISSFYNAAASRTNS